MREFSAAYLEHTRSGLWADRGALASLDLEERTSVLDVGCGTGELTAVLKEATAATVAGLDADRSLLAAAPADHLLCGDATRLPVAANSFDLVVCQAVLVNLPDPERALAEFARVADDAVATIEPNNAAVTVDSTVEAEPELARRARDAYIDGLETDVTLGDLTELFERVGLSEVSSTEHRHRKRIEPPYSDAAIEGAARKVSGTRLSEKREALLAGGLDAEGYASLLEDWQRMGRAVVKAMQSDTYERTETVPFHVTVGRV